MFSLKTWYRCHRWLGIIAVIPVMIWSASGLTHPLMAVAYKPNVQNQSWKPRLLPDSAGWLPLPEVLQAADIDQFNNARVVWFDEAPYYQVQTGAEQDAIGAGVVRYFSVRDGKELPDGDRKYAEQLAKHFLGDPTSQVTHVELHHDFTATYKIINRLLPVYRVQLDRGDGIEVYVHTFSDRLATANDYWRKGNLWVFSHGHTWDFLGPHDNPVRLILMWAFSLLAFIVGVSGIALYFVLWRTRKHAKTSTQPGLRVWHSRAGLIVSLSLFGFSGTGFWIATSKVEPEYLHHKHVRPVLTTADLPSDFLPQQYADSATGVNFGFVQLQGELCVQVFEQDSFVPKYYRFGESESIPEADQQYAKQLAHELTGWEQPISELQLVTEFGNRYPVVFKRLPVYRTKFEGPGLRVAHVETSSGHLSNSVTTSQLVRTIAFLQLHKYHFLDFLGPEARDAVMGSASLLLFLVSGMGLLLFLKSGKKSRASRTAEPLLSE